MYFYVYPMLFFVQAAVYAETWGDNYRVNLNDFAYKASSVRLAFVALCN